MIKSEVQGSSNCFLRSQEVQQNEGSIGNEVIQQQATNATSGLVEERVKVDRKRFEQMLSEGSSIGCDAESFFKRVMRSTNTQIMWPPKLKPGTKSKKDPHVRITGSQNSINAAKEIIFEQLDTRRNRVTLKMDVAFTDHSHIIGKGGRSIQRVMDETGCHIHFPDSNRTNTAEKSNQVSIAGSAEGVEQSRCRIREMLPITLQFDLPLNNGLHSPPTLDPQSPQLQAIQQSYGITITFRCDGSKCNNNSYFASSRIITVAVRGARSHLFGLRQGLSVLIEYLTGFRANTINVPLTMTIDVAVQHHSFIAGRANSNIRTIMQSTGASITLPDLNTLSATIPITGTTNTTNNCTSGSNSSSTSNLPALTSPVSSLSTVNSISAPAAVVAAAAAALTTAAGATASSSISDLTSICGQQASFMTTLTNNNPTFHGSNSNLAGTLSNIGTRKTAIVIKGPSFESVYSAWQELLGQLPLILIFDLKEGQDLDAVQVSKLMEQMRQISILIKPKQRQNTKSIVVRGPEKDSRLLFEVRKQILKLDDSEVPTNNCASLGQQLSTSTSSLQQQQQSSQQQLSNSNSITATDPELQMKAIKAILDPNLQKARQPTPYWAGLGFSKSVSEPMIKEKLSIGPLFSSNLTDERRISYSNENAIHDLTSSLQSLSSLDQPTTSKLFSDRNNNMNLIGLNNNSSSVTNNINSCGMLEKKHQNSITTNILDLNNNSNNNSNNISTTNNRDIINQHHHRQHSTSNNSNINHQHHLNQSNPIQSNIIPVMNTTTTSISNNQKISSCLRLAVFLGRIGLVQYLGLFTQHDIDLEMLFSLSENDFAELGLPYIHRRKLAIAIAEVKASIQNERAALSNLSSTFDAAPGAERSKRQKARGSLQGELSDIWSM